jgi:hypothetical protein
LDDPTAGHRTLGCIRGLGHKDERGSGNKGLVTVGGGGRQEGLNTARVWVQPPTNLLQLHQPIIHEGLHHILDGLRNWWGGQTAMWSACRSALGCCWGFLGGEVAALAQSGTLGLSGRELQPHQPFNPISPSTPFPAPAHDTRPCTHPRLPWSQASPTLSV